MKFAHTEAAAKVDKSSKWDLIAAIAIDAVENSLPITGVDSRLAAKAALDKVGNEHSDKTISDLCVVAKFDHESTAFQRKVWRRYGWTSVRTCANHGLTQEAAATLLAGERKSVRELEAALRRKPNLHVQVDPETLILRGIDKVDKGLDEMAEGIARAEAEGVDLTAHAELAVMVYERIMEKKLDADIREFFESETAQ